MEQEKTIFAPAKRQNLILLLGIVGKSGTGKTKSALLLARGLVGPKGRIKAIDSENRRMSYHADDPAIGGFDVADLQPPYSPERYLELLNEAQRSSDAVVIDSLSHEWNGEGGCLSAVDRVLDDRAGNDWAKRDKFKMFAWGQITPKHDALVAAICRSRVPLICCFRAKDKIVMEQKEEPGTTFKKTTISTDDDAPVQRKDLVHEMTMIFSLEQREGIGGYFTVRKRTTEGLYRAVSEKTFGEQLSVKHGEALTKWCANPSASSPAPIAQEASSDQRQRMFDKFKEADISEASLKAFAEQKGWLAPNEELGLWAMTRVPTTKGQMTALIEQVKKFLESGDV